jgi:phosphoheptose isomerase
MSNVITDHLRRSAEAKLRAAAECGPSIERAANLIAGSFNGGGKLLICGNGGSAADAQHMAAELIVRLTADFVRPGLPAIALTTDSSILTAYTNDFDFDGVFGRQVQALGRPGDALLGISTSGNSRNVLQAVEAARACTVSVVTLTGRHGRLADLADVAIQVPEDVTAHIQEVHLAIEHILCHLIERAVGTPGT